MQVPSLLRIGIRLSFCIQNDRFLVGVVYNLAPREIVNHFRDVRKMVGREWWNRTTVSEVKVRCTFRCANPLYGGSHFASAPSEGSALVVAIIFSWGNDGSERSKRERMKI